MMWEELEDVLDWLTNVNIGELDVSDQLRIIVALENFTDDITPIMERQLENERYKIDWDSFFNKW